LLSNYDERIDAAITFFREQFEVLRLKKPDSDTHKGETNLFTMSKELITYSNHEAIRTALSYCLGAIAELDRMRLAPALDSARFEELRRGIPDTGEMTE
jgi:hypothetical protein